MCPSAPIFARADVRFLQFGNILADLRVIDLVRGVSEVNDLNEGPHHA